MKVDAQHNLMSRSLDIVFGQDKSIVMPMTVKFMELPVGNMIEEPSLRLPYDAGQPLFDALWAVGYRPSKVGDSDAAIDALKNHITFAEGVAKTVLDSTHNPRIITVGPENKVDLI